MLRYGIALIALHTALAQTPVLLELFTSEGCNSCPPADALLRRLDSQQPFPDAQIIVLSEHVDYWNSLGWRDAFSSPQFTRRQQAYATALHSEPYTPQLVIDGREQMNGADAATVQAAIARAISRPHIPIRIASVKREGTHAVIDLAIPAQRTPADIWVALADESATSAVMRGENAGRSLDHVAVVRTLSKVGALRKSEAYEKTVRLPAGTASRVVVFLADPAGPVFGATAATIR